MKLTCTCQNIEIDWERTPGELHSRVCACDYCQSQNAEYVSEPDSVFSFQISDPANHRIIQHGHKTAKFHECITCGLGFATCEIQGQNFGIINAKVMGLTECVKDTNPRDYSGESKEERLERRSKNWSKVIG